MTRKTAGLLLAIVCGWLLAPAHPAAGQTLEPEADDSRIAPAAAGCVLGPILVEARDERGHAAIVIELAGSPSAHRATVESTDRIELSFSDCAPRSVLAIPEALPDPVAALRVVPGATDDAGAAATRIAIEMSGPFEYALSSRPGSFRVELWLDSELDAAPGLVRVAEPLPVEALPAPAAPPPPAETAPAEQPLLPDHALNLSERIEHWGRTWSDRRIEDHLALYAPEFRPSGKQDRAAWEADRRRRLASGRGEIILDQLAVRLDESGQEASTTFWLWGIEGAEEGIHKSLRWSRRDDEWMIVEERGAVVIPSSLSEPAPPPARTAPPRTAPPATAPTTTASTPTPTTTTVATAPASPVAAALLAGARSSIERAPRYDPEYRVIGYPGGDPGLEVGTGVDLVVRAFRALGADLQQRIHEDILAAPETYGIEETDVNVDHRRIRNLLVFLRRHGRELPADRGADWRPGDVVLWALEDGAPNHTGIVSDRRGASGDLLVIHHPPGGIPREADVLFAWPVRAHFRWLPRADESRMSGG